MASIQILEIAPVEAQIEDLSDDITSSIHGGSIFGQIDMLVDAIIDLIGGTSDQVINCTLSFLRGESTLGQYIDCLLKP